MRLLRQARVGVGEELRCGVAWVVAKLSRGVLAGGGRLGTVAVLLMFAPVAAKLRRG